MSFKINGAAGEVIAIPDGDYYFNTKARGRRMMANSLSSDARRVQACLELATMGFQQELAVTMDRGERRPLTPTDISQQTGLSRQNVRRGFEELDEAGLAKRVAADGGALRRGQVLIYSWATPREPKREVCSRPRLQTPEWFPETWEPLKPLISRFKYSIIDDEVAARDYKEEIDAAARAYKEAEIVAVRALEKVCAGRKGAAASLYRKEQKEHIERTTSSSSAVSSSNGRVKAEEEDQPPYEQFKAEYPADHFDEAKTKPSFEGKTKTQQLQVLERLRVFKASPRWKDQNGRWIPLSSNWLPTCDADPPPLIKPKGATPAKKGFTESVMEEAKRRFEKYGRV